MQSKMERCHRYIWSSTNKPLLREIEENRKNRWDGRETKTSPVRSKVDRRSLERFGHVIRIPEHRTTEQVTFGWL